tara:strand:+ start:3147 stop:3344 length:198 start_codon:yes stop_codon:yes gene_type:complete
MYLLIFFLLNKNLFIKRNNIFLNFELGNNNEILKINETSNLNNKKKNNDCALIPLKNLPKNKPLW